MVESSLPAWLLTIVFTATGLWFCVRCVQPAGSGLAGFTIRSSDLAHAVMSAAMIAMVWPWGMAVPSGPQIMVFGVAAIGYLVLAVGGVPAPRHVHGNDRIARLHHAVTMAVMV